MKKSTVTRGRSNKRQVRLTPNEREILQRISEGDSIADIAEAWGRSKTVVYRQLEAAEKALKAKSPAHAVALWLKSNPTA